jgi:tetratricopeptide (TPR) repeat protein
LVSLDYRRNAFINITNIIRSSSKNNFYDSALSYYSKTLKYSPTWLMPRLMIGRVYNKIGRQDLAFKWFVSILKMDSVYKEFECAKCFYEELNDLYYDTKKHDYRLFRLIEDEFNELNPNVFKLKQRL